MPNVKPEEATQGIDQYRDKIVLYLSKRVPSKDVEDCAQETFLTAQTYLHNGNTLNKPLGFLYKAANFVVGKNYRSRKIAAMIDTVADIDALGLESDAPSVEQRAMSEREFEAFCVAIGRLPDKCREAFVMRKVYQYSYREIAKHCEVSPDTVRNHCIKGLKLVHEYYKERDSL